MAKHEKIRKVPLRMCLGCGEMIDKRTLVRVVRNKEGEMSVDLTGKKPGRGAYICHNVECLAAAIKRKRLQRAFSCEISNEIFEALKQEITL